MAKESKMISCAHYVSKYLPLTENWIYKIIINHEKYDPVFFARKGENRETFPISNLYVLADFNALRKVLELAGFKLFGYFSFIRNVATQKNVRVLHVHFGYHGAKMVGLKKKLNVPMVCSFYGDDAFAHRYAGRYKQLFKHADKILVLGAYMRKRLIAMGCDERKIAIHHLGIDINAIRFIARSVSQKDRIRFLMASSFVRKKGIDIALSALARFVPQHDFVVDIIGDGPLRAEIVRQIEDSGMKGRVTLHGYRPYNFVIDLAYQCHVFLQASRTTEHNEKEGTPMAIVDAMATGLPVISTRHSDIPEIVIDGENGYLADENSVDSLAASIQKIFDDVSVIGKFSPAARTWIEKEFDAVKQTRKLEACYDELVLASQDI